MVNLIIDKRLKSLAGSFQSSKSIYKIINKQLYFFLDRYQGQKKVELKGSFSDIDIYCNRESSYYRELKDFFNENKEVIFFGYDNNFSKYLFWQYINEFDLDAKIILKRLNQFSNFEYHIKSQDIRKSLAIYYLNSLVNKEIDKEFKLVNIYEAFLFNKSEKNNLVQKKNKAEIENSILYTKKRPLDSEFDIKNKIIKERGLQFLIREFYDLLPTKKDIEIIIYILEKYNVLKTINSGAEQKFTFIDVKDIFKLKTTDLNNIFLDYKYVNLSQQFSLKARSNEEIYAPNTALLRQLINLDYSTELIDITLNYYKFLISISLLIYKIFVKDFFSNFITSNEYYAINTKKLSEIIHEISDYYPISLKIIGEDVAKKIQEDLNKKDDFMNLNELILKNDMENIKIYKSNYQLHKLGYIAKVQPNLLKRESLKEIDHGISLFMHNEINYQNFREKMKRLLAGNSTQDH